MTDVGRDCGPDRQPTLLDVQSAFSLPLVLGKWNNKAVSLFRELDPSQRNSYRYFAGILPLLTFT